MSSDELPFEVAPKSQTVEVGNAKIGVLKLPKRWSVTTAEELEVIRILKAADLCSDEGMIKTNMALATIALRRIKPEFCESDAANLSLPLIDEVADYLLSERNGWQKLDPGDSEKKSTGTLTNKASSKTRKKPSGDSKPVSLATKDSAPKTMPTPPST